MSNYSNDICSKCNNKKEYVKNKEFLKQEKFTEILMYNPSCDMTTILEYINNKKIKEYIKLCINCKK